MDFSQLVDTVASSVGKPFDTEQFARIVNMAIRYVEKSTNNEFLHIEEEVCALSCSNGVVWEIPDVKRYMRIVYAEDLDGTPADEVKASKAIAEVRRRGLPYFYHAGRNVSFGNIRQGVRFTWMNHSPWFAYFKRGSRPANCVDGLWDREMPLPLYDQVTSLTLETQMELVFNRACQMHRNKTNDPAAGNADREYQRVWNADTVNAS